MSIFVEEDGVADIEAPANARSRRTRQALLDAARAILEQQGFQALTMSALAERAGVTRGGVYLHFDSVPAVMTELFDHLAETEGLGASLARVWEAEDAVTALDAWAAHLADYHPRLMAVDTALQRAERSGPVDEHRAKVAAAQLDNCRRLAAWLADDGRLAARWTVATATDVLYGLICTELISRLLVDRGWSRDELRKGLAALFRSTLVAR